MNFFIIRTNIVQNMGSFQQRKHCPNANKVALITEKHRDRDEDETLVYFENTLKIYNLHD